MSATSLLHTVFFSYSPRDAETAERIKHDLTEEGLRVQDGQSDARTRSPSALRDAIAESEVMLVLATEAFIQTSSLVVEVGMAQAWRKPIFVLTKDIPVSALPGFLRDFDVYPLDNLDRVIGAIHKKKLALTLEEMEWLREWYGEQEVPLDKMITQAKVLEDLARGFKKTWKRSVTPERLVRELIRLRKQGTLRRKSASQN